MQALLAERGRSARRMPQCGILSETGRSPWMEVPRRGGRGISKAEQSPWMELSRSDGRGRREDDERCHDVTEGTTVRTGEAFEA